MLHIVDRLFTLFTCALSLSLFIQNFKIQFNRFVSKSLLNYISIYSYMAFNCLSSPTISLVFTDFTSSTIFTSFVCAALAGQVPWISSQSDCSMRVVCQFSTICQDGRKKNDFNQMTYLKEARCILYLNQVKWTPSDLLSPKFKIL